MAELKKGVISIDELLANINGFAEMLKNEELYYAPESNREGRSSNDTVRRKTTQEEKTR